MKTGWLVGLLGALFCAGFTSCVSTTYPVPTAAEKRIGATLTAPKGKALVVMYRRSEGLHSRMIPSAAYVDGERRGYTGVGSFIVIPVTPGRHWASSGTGGTAEGNPSSIRFSLASGDRVFFRQSVKQFVNGGMLVPAGPVLTFAPTSGFADQIERVAEDVALREISKCQQHGADGEISVSTWP